MFFKKPISMAMVPLLAAFTLFIGACTDSGSGDGTTSQPPLSSGGPVTIAGTVSGTVIKVVGAQSGAVIAQTDTASLPGPPPFPFSLPGIPTGVPVKVFFFSAGQTFPLYIGTPATTVFTVLTAGPLDLGSVTLSTGGGNALPQNQPPPGSIELGPFDPSVPPGVAPPPATLSVAAPGPATGSVVVNFSVQNFSIGSQGQQHLHISVGGGPTRHFFNGSSNKVVDGNGNPTADVQWQSPSSFRLNGLSVGTHQVTVRLATASESQFVNPEANPSAVTVTITSPPTPPPTVNITSPSAGASLPSGPVDVSFSVQNFTIGSQGASHLHIYLDGGAAAHFFNGQILDGSGAPVSNMTWQGPNSFRITGLPSGPHQIRLALADAAHQDLQNAEANPPTLNISIQAPPGSSTITVTSGTTFLSSPVTISFSVTNFTIGLPGTPHMRFSIDGGPLHDFYNGAGINSDNGVLLNGVHDHAVHWASSNSFVLFGLTAAAHQVSLVLVDGANNSVGASAVHNFTVQQPPTGDLQLQPVINNLSFPVGLSPALDGRVLYAERLTGAIRVINPGWVLDPTPFCSVSITISGEQGLLGLVLDPNFTSNQSVYVYYTAPGPQNRISKLTKSGGTCTETPILWNLPTSTNHNGGIIKFGPDGMLYAVVGDAESPSEAQNLTSLRGKILRLNPADGSGVPGNPFYGSGNANQDRVYSYGHRNSYGFTFHNGILWESENGPADNDEVNRVVLGANPNYGWPVVGGFAGNPSYRDPILVFNPVIAPTGIIGIPGSSSVYPPAYRNNLLMAAWNDGTIRLVIPNGTNPDQPGTTSVAYTGGQGGLLSFMLGTDGYIYVSNGLFSGTFPHYSSSIFRVVPH